MRKHFLTILFLSCLITGCNKEIGVYPLGEMKGQNPFSGSEILSYLNNNNDTIIFMGQGRYTEEIQSPFDGTGSEKYYTNEIDKCSFTDQENKFELYIQLASRTSSTHHGSSTGYLMDIWFKDQSEISKTNCRCIASHITLPIIDHQNSNSFYDSLLISGTYYYNVVAFSNLVYSGVCTESMSADTIFYCTTNGIIKLSFNNNTSWSLLNVTKKNIKKK
ncbi:MAG: hypothetical protein CVT99_04700 [Bacteroidetes bacterium HGW-Bacteroidetes-16]|jgi:hypothetical protein|nr:MAG: hypothetical protein CVT99_04700 [Bacteroidetes bacterium HGW-Bacteroidetes-16]